MSVRKIEIKDKSLFADGKVFGEHGQFYQIDGTIEFAVDPNNKVNETITDLKLAPTNSDGRVAFTSKFSLITSSSFLSDHK